MVATHGAGCTLARRAPAEARDGWWREPAVARVRGPRAAKSTRCCAWSGPIVVCSACASCAAASAMACLSSHVAASSGPTKPGHTAAHLAHICHLASPPMHASSIALAPRHRTGWQGKLACERSPRTRRHAATGTRQVPCLCASAPCLSALAPCLVGRAASLPRGHALGEWGQEGLTANARGGRGRRGPRRREQDRHYLLAAGHRKQALDATSPAARHHRLRVCPLLK